MSTIVTRSGKGVPLTATDHDNNVNNLNTDKVETLADLSITSTATEINLLDGVTATTAELNYVDGVTSNIQTQLGTKLPLAGGTMTGTIAGFTSTGIDDNATSTAITISASDNVGIGITNPYSPFQVKTTGNALSHFGGTQGASGTYQGISLGHSESSIGTYRKTAIVAESTGDGYTRQDFNILVDISADGNSAVLGDSKFKISGTTGICNAKNGITFGTDTAAANALDDYEEGTWTPVITMSSTAPSVTHTGQVGRYTKIGNIVTIYADIHWSSLSGGTGNARIVLPFTAMSAKYFKPETRSYSGLSVGVDKLPAGYTNTANLELQKITQSTGTESPTSWHASGRYNFQITMMV